MKKLLILLCALMLTGCAAGGAGKNSASSSDLIEYPEGVVASSTRTSSSDLELHDPWGITMSVEDVTRQGCTIVVEQSGGRDVAELMTGAAFVLEVKDGDDWTACPTLFEDSQISWTMEGWMIPLGGSAQWQTDWSWLYGELPAGEYRISKDVMNFRAAGDYDEITYYAEFVIE